MCNKAVDNYLHALEFFLDCDISQKMCNEAINTHPSTTQYVPDQFKTQEMFVTAINRCFFFVFDSILDRYKTQEMYDIVVSLYPFLNSTLP